MTRASEKGRIRWDAMPLTPTGYAKLALGALLLAGLVGCGQDQKAFLAERRAEAVGYRLEHFESERLIFVHHPNGEKDGVELARLQRVFLRRQKASDSVDGKTRYFWDFGGPDRGAGRVR